MDPAKMKVVDLRSELGALGLDTKGNKPALVERLKKALEAKTGKAIGDTTILDTSSEDIDDTSTTVPSTPRRAAAVRTTRRSSSSRLASTPVKAPLEDPPKSIEEEPSEDDSPKSVQPPAEEPEPVPDPKPEVSKPQESEDTKEDLYDIEDEQSQSSADVKTESEKKEEAVRVSEDIKMTEDEPKSKEKSIDREIDHDTDTKDEDYEDMKEREERERELTEEEEWELLNERLIQKEKERIEREKKQAEDDEKRLKEVSKDPIKLLRLQRKQEKKARWSNFYKSIEITNEVLAPTVEDSVRDDKTQLVDAKLIEPELDDSKVTLSWYDSDLNQYLELPELNSVVTLSEGAFSHAWSGTRATHGVTEGRVCYEVRVGTVVTTTEITEKEIVANGLRVGWSTDDSNLHLGESELSWGYESTGRAVSNSEFKEYGKTFTEKDVVGVYLDLQSNPCKIAYTLNGAELGTAFEFEKSQLNGAALFPHILTKNTSYRVNFGHDRYNMLTRTKIVRKRLEIPVEQVLEEKRKKEEEIKKQKEEAERLLREKREKDRKEREERLRKKREEREKIEKEKKGKVTQEKNDREEAMEEDNEEEEKEKVKDTQEGNEQENPPLLPKEEMKEEPKENGENQAETTVEVKTETMDTEEKPPVEKDGGDVKDDPSDEVQEVTEEQVLTGQVLDDRIKFVIRYTVEEELDGAEGCLIPGYVLLTQGVLVEGPRRPRTIADCEVILMVGMPGSGKTYWTKKHCAENPTKRYNIISTGALFDKMKVDCKPFRSSYDGKWDGMVSKCAKSVLKLLEIAKGRHRNYILDQTNVYPSAQRRKLREFEGYRRIAVCVIVADEVQKQRSTTREAADGKEVPDPAILDMKANFALPEVGPLLNEVIYPELSEEEAKKVLATYHQEAAEAGAVKEKDKRSRSASRSRDAPPSKRQRSMDKDRRDYRRRDHPREREDRWGGGGGGGGSRWGAAPGGGPGGRGRWGGSGRDRGGGMGPGPRFDRGWGAPPPGGRNDYGRDRDVFRGGRGGPGGPRQDRGPGAPGGPGGLGGMGPARVPPESRFQRDNRPQQNRSQIDNKRSGQSQGSFGSSSSGSGGGGGGGSSGGNQSSSGSWQRGSQQSRGGRSNQVSRQDSQNQAQSTNQSQNQNQNQNQGWNQWAGGWGGWGNWNNQNQGWNNYNNWGNWNNQPQGGQQQQQGGNKQQWSNYTAQQWYQWQQWQQQQGQWQGYNQASQQQSGSGQQGGANTSDTAQAWAQYYQSYGGANMPNSNSPNSPVEKK